MSAQLTYEFGADLDKLNLSINEATNLIKKFGKDAANAGQQDIGKLNAEILRLNQYVDKLKNVGLPGNLPDNFKRSTIALTDLSRVIQDLPFGFIAIQNNIPALVQSFGNLTKEGGGLLGGLKLLGSSLLGPVGLGFAISSITSLITVAVKEYGSLGAAFDALFGKVNPLKNLIDSAAKSQEEYNKSVKTTGQIIGEAYGSVEAQIIKVQTLAGVVNDLSKSEELRKNALSSLQQISKAYFGDFKFNTTSVEELTAAVDKYTDSLIANAVAESYKVKVTESAKNIEEQKALLKELGKSYEGVLKERKKVAAQEPGFDPLSGAQLTPNVANIGKDIEDSYNKQVNLVSELYKGQNLLADSYKNATLEALKFFDEVEKKEKKEAEREPTRRSKQSQKELLRIAKENAQLEIDIQNDKFKREDNAFKVLRDAYISTLTDREQELYKIEEDYENKRSTLLRSNIDDFASIEEEKLIRRKEVNDKYDKIALNDLDRASKERLRIQEEDGKAARKLFELSFVKQKGESETEEDQKRLQDNYIKTGKIIQTNLTAPLNELFDIILSKGQKSWQDFTKTILDSLKKLIVKLAIAAAIAATLSIISGGTANAAKGGLSFKEAFGSLLGIKLGGKSGSIANPGFGGISPGGMAMNGSVNLVLRGQDLVGSLNRTNSQLSRIG